MHSSLRSSLATGPNSQSICIHFLMSFLAARSLSYHLSLSIPFFVYRPPCLSVFHLLLSISLYLPAYLSPFFCLSHHLRSLSYLPFLSLFLSIVKSVCLTASPLLLFFLLYPSLLFYLYVYLSVSLSYSTFLPIPLCFLN